LKENILLVDDDVFILNAFEEILTENGYSVGRAASENEALVSLEAQNYHMAIIDVVLQDTNGIELIAKIRAKSKQTAIIMITGFPSVESAVGSFRCGSFDYLEKPCKREVLVDAIQKGLREKEEKEDFEKNKNDNIKQFFWSLERESFKKLYNAKSEIIRLEKELSDLRRFKEKVQARIEKPDTVSELLNEPPVILEEPLFKGLKVLVVDSHVPCQKLIHDNLQELGCRLDFAFNGMRAIEMLKSKKYDVCLSEIRLPDIDGFEVARRIRKEIGNELPIIAVTASAMAEDKEKCLDAGMNDYVAKPIDIELVKKKMLYWVGRKNKEKSKENDYKKLDNLDDNVCMIHRIGVIAGEILEYLERHENYPLQEFYRVLDFPGDHILMSIGWLTRNGHIVLKKNVAGGFNISLKKGLD